MTLRAHWCKDTNFGDALTPWILEKLFDQHVEFAQPSADYITYMVTGSILNWSLTNAIVWGCGLASTEVKVALDYKEIRAVRGPISADIARRCGAQVPATYGDPALLLPRWYQPSNACEGLLGIIPHYIDMMDARSKIESHPEIMMIDILQSIEHVIEQIARCDRVLSSSLHGLIAAHAYGIPAELCVFGDRLEGDGLKFLDYAESIGHSKLLKHDMRKTALYSALGLLALPIKMKIREIDLDALWKVRPVG